MTASRWLRADSRSPAELLQRAQDLLCRREQLQAEAEQLRRQLRHAHSTADRLELRDDVRWCRAAIVEIPKIAAAMQAEAARMTP